MIKKKLLTIFLEHKIFGFISRWSIFLLWMYSRPATKQAMKMVIGLTKYILVCSSGNRLCLQIWYRKSPP